MDRALKSLRDALKSQYHAALAMLREAIDRCPDDLWTAGGHLHAYWQNAYHALFFAHFYLQPDEASFRPWRGHQSRVQYPDAIGGPPERDSTLPMLPEPYTRAQALEYWALCDGMVDSAIDTLDLDAPTSGFDWYPIPKLEHLLVNLRHIQHHTAQLADRLRTAADIGVRWVGARPSR